MSLKSALGYLGMAKSSYLYKPEPQTIKRPRNYKMDPDLKEAISNLAGYELTLGYTKTTSYLRDAYSVIWNKKKVYKHMRELGVP